MQPLWLVVFQQVSKDGNVISRLWEGEGMGRRKEFDLHKFGNTTKSSGQQKVCCAVVWSLIPSSKAPYINMV